MIDKILLEFAEKMQALTESSLTRVMSDPLGHKLAQYMHTHLGIPHDAEIKPVSLDYIAGKATWSNPEFVIFKGKNGWVLREPNSFVPVVITADEPNVESKTSRRQDNLAWEKAIEPVAVYSVVKPPMKPEVLARSSRQPARKNPELMVSHKLLEPNIVSSIVHGARVQIKRENPQLKRPRQPETVKAWLRWLSDLQNALTEGENEVMSDIDWDEARYADDDRFAEAEDFWNSLVFQAIRNQKEWMVARNKDSELFQKNAPTPQALSRRGFATNLRIGPNISALMNNTVFLQKVKEGVLKNLIDFTYEHTLV